MHHLLCFGSMLKGLKPPETKGYLLLFRKTIFMQAFWLNLVLNPGRRGPRGAKCKPSFQLICPAGWDLITTAIYHHTICCDTDTTQHLSPYCFSSNSKKFFINQATIRCTFVPFSYQRCDASQRIVWQYIAESPVSDSTKRDVM